MNTNTQGETLSPIKTAKEILESKSEFHTLFHSDILAAMEEYASQFKQPTPSPSTEEGIEEEAERFLIPSVYLKKPTNEDELKEFSEFKNIYIKGVERGRQMQGEDWIKERAQIAFDFYHTGKLHGSDTDFDLNQRISDYFQTPVQGFNTEETTSHEEAEEFIQNWLKSRNHSYGYGIKIDCETVAKIMQEYAQSKTFDVQEELKKSRSKITELIGEISDLKDVINPARVTSKKSFSMD